MASSPEPLSPEHVKVSAPESDLNMGKDVSDRHSVFDEMEDDKPSLTFMGRDLAQIPCFKESMTAGIGAGGFVGIAYNIATSRPPWVKSYLTFCTVSAGYFLYCRYFYRMEEHNYRIMAPLMNDYARLRGTAAGRKEAQQMDEQWAADALKKKTNIRDYREDSLTDKDSPGLIR